MKGEGWEPGDPIPLPLPEWASRHADGDYTITGAALPTRDGRRTGNAVNAGPVTSLNPDPTFLVVTDAGNRLKMTVAEMQQYFYPPEYVMEHFLTAVQESLRNQHD